MLEKQIEHKLVAAVRHAGGLCPKFVSPGMDGMPDRLVLMPGGRIFFVELKAPGKQPRPLQLHRHDQLRKLGFEVYVIDSLEEVSRFVETFVLDSKPSEAGLSRKRTSSEVNELSRRFGEANDTELVRTRDGGCGS